MPKNIVVTGGNNGIGYETVRAMFKDGHHVIFGSRNTQKNQQAVNQITSEGGDGTLKSFGLDLSKKHSVEQFARYIKDNFDHIDILVNNAGLMMGSEKVNSQEIGFQMTLVVNHFGHFYLTYLLFDLLKRSQQSRIINLSSTAHFYAGQDFLDDLACEHKKYKEMGQYQISKLFNVVFTVGLNELFKRNNLKNIKTASVHPGVVDTGFGNLTLQESGCFRCLKACFSCCMRTQEAGATTSVYLCRVPFQVIQSGEYYDSDTAIKDMNKLARSLYYVQKLWKISEKAYGINFS